MNQRISCHPRFSLTCSVVLLLLLAGGCRDEVYSRYGVRSGYAETSLNGTRVLADMFSAAGHRVTTRRHLSPALDRADVIVWFPDDFNTPTPEVELWLSYWLAEGLSDRVPRVLVYVGRDYDAAPDYWQRMQGQAPAGLKNEYARRLTEAKLDASSNKPASLSRSTTEDWFELDATAKTKQVKQLGGPWAVGVDSAKIEIERRTRMKPDEYEFDALLTDENNEPLVSEFAFSPYSGSTTPSRLIMIENGSWLLNARLVNKQHRRLAGQLVASVGQQRANVVFLESDDDGPPIRDTEPSVQQPTGFMLFGIWPIGAVLTQLAILGIVFAMMKWPIFGVPRSLKRKSVADFGSHIAALGQLLQSGRSRSHAIGLLQVFRQSLRRELPVLPKINPTSQPSSSQPPQATIE